MRALLIAAVLLLPACRTIPVPQAEPPPPVQVTCAPQAKERCQTQPPLWQPPDPRSPDAWKLVLPQVLLPVVRELNACDLRVAAAQACLDEAQAKGVLIWR